MGELPTWASQNNSDYLQERVRRYNEAPSDDLLYRIGSCMDTFTSDDEKLLREIGYSLTPEQRYRTLNQLLCSGFQIEGDLALLIFGRDQLIQWLEISRQAYPDFEFFLSFEFRTKFQSGCDDGICFTMHWMPNPGAPEPSVECDFPWRLYWEAGEMFWGDYPDNTKNQFDFNFSCYPNQQSFATRDSFCEVGSRYTTPTDEEADLMSVEQVLNCPALNARWT